MKQRSDTCKLVVEKADVIADPIRIYCNSQIKESMLGGPRLKRQIMNASFMPHAYLGRRMEGLRVLYDNVQGNI